jgi:tetratricopeptide (TPR) repeat protein
MKKISSLWSEVNLSSREHASIILFALTMTPFFRGGRDPIGLFFMASCLLLAAILWINVPKKRLSSQFTKIHLTILVFVDWMIISLLWTSDLYHGVTDVIFWLLGAMTGCLAALVLTSKARRLAFIRYVLLLSLPVAIFGIYNYLAIPFDRATSFFYWPNPLALYLAIVIILGTYEYWQKRSNLTLGLLIINASVFMLSESLATFVWFAVALGFLWYFVSKNRQKALIDIVTVFFVGLLLANGFTQLKENVFNETNIGTPDEIEQLVELKSQGIQDRFDFWDSSLQMASEKPINGSGAGSFAIEYPQHQKSVGSAVSNPHNIYIQTLTELGVVGVGLLLAGIFIFIWTAWRNKTIFYPGLIILGLWLLHAGFYQTNRYPVLISWLFVALVLSVGISRKRVPVPRWYIPTIICSLILILIPAYAIFNADTFAKNGEELGEVYDVERSIAAYEKANAQLLSNPDHLSSQAWQEFLIGDRDSALETIDKAIARDESDAIHYYLKGFILAQRQRYDEAEVYLLKSIELDPLNNVRAYITYADLLLDQYRVAEAKELVDSVLPLFSDSEIERRSGIVDLKMEVGLLHWQRSRVAAGEDDPERALLEAQETLRLRPNYLPAVNLIETLSLTRQPSQ